MQLNSVTTWMILFGFLLNAGAPPLSAWLADAYPEASFSGMVFLSAFTTKTAIYVLLRGFPGTDLLIYIGLFIFQTTHIECGYMVSYCIKWVKTSWTHRTIKHS